MPVAVEPPVPYPIITPTLTQDLYNGSKSQAVPINAYDEMVKPLLDQLAAKNINPTTKFDPAKHILFTDDYFDKTTRLTLKDLQQEDPHQEPISDIGVTEPFPLFTEEAIDIMRYELFQKETFLEAGRINEHSNTGDLDLYVRGIYSHHSPFTVAAWNHPRTLEIISRMAGVELLHQNEYEAGGHSNVTIKSSTTKIIDDKLVNDIEGQDANDIKATFKWHYDSPQFVCVLMLSDTSKMTGGETALLMGNGKVAKVAGPKQGWANVLQGRVLKHIASKPLGDFAERIATVGSFRPKDPMKDHGFMTTTKPSTLKGSRYNEYYKDWMNYRYDVLMGRIQGLKDQLNEDFAKGKIFDQVETIKAIEKYVVEYAERSYQEFEVVDDGVVPKPKSYDVIKSRFDEV